MFLKITNRNETHHGLKYKTGLNIDPVPFRKEGSCCPGGIYFTTPAYIVKFMHLGRWVREVTIPKDAQKVRDPSRNKWRASKVVLGERKDLGEISTWKWLIENGLNVNANNNAALYICSEYGNAEVIKFLIKNGAVVDKGSLQKAIFVGNLDVVKLLVKHGKDNGANIKYARACVQCKSWFKCKPEILKYLKISKYK